MPTPLHLNTTVNGSVGTVREAADYFLLGSSRAESAADNYIKARTETEAGWRGPAGEAYRDAIVDPARVCLDIQATCAKYEPAVRTFADRLEKVISQMADVIATAKGGGLEVQGPIVMRPKHPGPPPADASGVVPPNAAADELRHRQAAHASYTNVVSDYNAKVKVFNESLEKFKAARNLEEQAHTDVWQELGADNGFDIDGWTIGDTAASSAIGTIGAADGVRSDALFKAKQLETLSRPFMEFAAGGIPSKWSQAQRDRFIQAGLKAEGGKRDYLRRVRQIDKFLDKSPKWLTKASTAYPGKRLLGLEDIGPKASDLKAARGVLKSLPYLGSGLVIGNEIVSAAKGEQTWGKAVADTAGTLGGGAIGGVAGASLCSPLAPPWGSIVCGAAGGAVGGFVGGEVADWFVPEEDVDMPKPADTIDYHPSSRRGR